MTNYGKDYFEEGIFDTDYTFLAEAIIKLYNPKRIIELGCGPGHLTKALAGKGIHVTAVDGYSSPNFADNKNITFSELDLNNPLRVESLLNEQSTFDLAICMEVAEHIHPDSSNHLIRFLTLSASTIIFSAALPNQGGNGHINCRPRLFWHKLFFDNDFILINNLRKEIQPNENLAIWYRLNALDYVKKTSINITNEMMFSTIENLLDNESYSSDLFYAKSNEVSRLSNYLNYPLIKQYLIVRSRVKRIFS